MKKIILAVCALLVAAGATAQNKPPMNKNKTLVAYFSCTGNTKRAAQQLAAREHADLYEIKPAEPYTAADLNWNDKQSRSYREMHDPSSRPAIADRLPDMKQYDTLYVGYPIWWNLAPTIINTFLEQLDVRDKTLFVFATSGGNTVTNSEKKLHEAYPKIRWGVH